MLFFQLFRHPLDSIISISCIVFPHNDRLMLSNLDNKECKLAAKHVSRKSSLNDFHIKQNKVSKAMLWALHRACLSC